MKISFVLKVFLSHGSMSQWTFCPCVVTNHGNEHLSPVWSLKGIPVSWRKSHRLFLTMDVVKKGSLRTRKAVVTGYVPVVGWRSRWIFPRSLRSNCGRDSSLRNSLRILLRQSIKFFNAYYHLCSWGITLNWLWALTSCSMSFQPEDLWRIGKNRQRLPVLFSPMALSF